MKEKEVRYMREVYFGPLGRSVLVPFLKSGELETFPEISEDDISKLNDTVEKFTAAKTSAARQKILSDYAASIDDKDGGSGFYKAMFGMLLNLRREVYKSQ